MIIKPGKETVLVISDTQCPFEHKDTVKFLTWAKNKYKPTKVVHIGDELDFHCLSRYFKDPDGYGAGQELTLGINHLSPLYKLFPKVMVCTSNHVDRPYDRAFEAGIPKSFLKDIKTVLEAPEGWEWSDKWVIDNIAYIHGHVLPGGKHGIQRAATEYPRSVVFGHVHAHAGIYYRADTENLRFAMNVGCLVNNEAYAFVYGKKYVNKPIIGCGVVRKGLPTFVPMILNKQGRWINR
jgi:predicted phosphodiesterase